MYYFREHVTFDFNLEMLESVVKRSEFAYTREQRYTNSIYCNYDDNDDHDDAYYHNTVGMAVNWSTDDIYYYNNAGDTFWL